ncbi:MAG TPA: BadF/BadG/BcrA/BcrD ATPase family protein [Galbitalea sp.]
MGAVASRGAEPVVVGVDGGGSKTDAVALTLDGELIARASDVGSSPHFIGVEESVRQVDRLVREVSGGREVLQANLYLSGIDLPIEVDVFRENLSHLPWASEGTVIDNDLYALLRAGTSARDAVAVVCGSGINAIGRRADGQTARFAALGMISGDWGGGTGIGEAAIWNAVRGNDLRGPHTSLTAAIPGSFGLATIDEVTHALHLNEFDYSDLGRLSPLVFEHADAGDAVSIALVRRQGTEIALMAISAIERLGMTGHAVPVVLGGGVVASGHPILLDAVRATLSTRTPNAAIVHVATPPIVGAALLAFESAGATSDALDRAREELER